MCVPACVRVRLPHAWSYVVWTTLQQRGAKTKTVPNHGAEEKKRERAMCGAVAFHMHYFVLVAKKSARRMHGAAHNETVLEARLGVAQPSRLRECSQIRSARQELLDNAGTHHTSEQRRLCSRQCVWLRPASDDESFNVCASFQRANISHPLFSYGGSWPA